MTPDENEFVRGCLDDTEFIKLLSGSNVTGASDGADDETNQSVATFEYDEHVPRLEI